MSSPSSCARSSSGAPAQDKFDALPWRLRPRGETAAISGPRSGKAERGGGISGRGGGGHVPETSGRPMARLGRPPQTHLQSGRVQDANGKNPIRFSLHRRVFRLPRRSSASRVAAQPGAPCPQQQRSSGERDGQACLEGEVEGAPGPGRRGAAEQGRQAAAGGSPQRLVGKKDRPRGRIVQPGAKGRGGRPGGGP